MAIGHKTGGRQKGTPNKLTASVRAALEMAFEGIGGVPKLRAWAEKEPTEFYKLWAKLLPTQLVGGDPGSDPIRQRIEQVIVDPKAEN
jgi:hypothetical protein